MNIETKRVSISTSKTVVDKANELSTKIFGKPNISAYFAYIITEKYEDMKSSK